MKLARKEDDDRPLCICVSPDGLTAAVGCDTGKLWFLRTEDGCSAAEVGVRGYPGNVQLSFEAIIVLQLH